ncbi:hypothetical protein AX14_007041 [Amanita brunnescens Koide BX004]|nr:hypothetical protein AX14_007041 [Amanita brunnescens Koide BX004]
MDHPNMSDEPPHIPPFAFYPPEHDQSYNLTYSAGLAPYQVMQHAANQPRHLLPDLHQQGLHQFHSLSLITPHQYQSPVFASSPPHVPIPLSNSPPPPSPDMYDPMSPPVSGSDTSADGFYHHSNSSGANSPSSSRGTSLVHRHIRYNPSPSPTSSSGRRRRGRSHDSDEEDNMGVAFTENLAHSRKEATRRQRIEAEQRRRDELRDGYAKLKEVLPISNQKSSKVSLLERATNHIVALEKANKELRERLASLEQEMQRLRSINEKISLTATEAASPSVFDGRTMSPAPDGVHPVHSLASVKGQHPPLEDSSPSASENGY